VAIAFDLPFEKCLERNRARAERVVDEDVIALHAARFEWAMGRLRLEGYARVYVLDEANLNDAVIERV
jgi:predicted kinase